MGTVGIVRESVRVPATGEIGDANDAWQRGRATILAEPPNEPSRRRAVAL